MSFNKEGPLYRELRQVSEKRHGTHGVRAMTLHTATVKAISEEDVV